MFADDVAALVTAPNIPELNRKLSVVAEHQNAWFEANSFALNLDKTVTYILTSPIDRRRP